MKHQNQLKKLQPISLTDIEIKKTDEYICIAGIVEFGDGDCVLEISVYENVDGRAEALVRHFIDVGNMNYGTYFVKEDTVGGVRHKAGEWSSMKYQTIISKGYSGYYQPKNTRYVSSSEEIILEYLKREDSYRCYGGVENSIESFENGVSFNKKISAEERKRERIRNRMSLVKPTDERFREWLMQKVFPERYLFAREMTSEGRKCYCSECCSTSYVTEKLKHNEKHICKVCGTELVVKTRQKAIARKANVMVIQPYDSVNYVIRHFRVYLLDEIQDDLAVTRLRKHERIRVFRGEDFHGDIYYGEANMVDEELQGWWTEKHGTVIDSKMYLYPEGIKDIFAERGLKETLYKMASEQWLFDYHDFIRAYFNKPYIEYVVKAGMRKLAGEITALYYYGPHWLCTSGENLKELMRLNGQQVNRIREIDGGQYAIEALQRETVNNPFSRENLEYLDKNQISITELCTDKTGLRWNKVINYLRRQQEKYSFTPHNILQYYKDYLRMAAERGMDLNDDIVRLNSRMVEWHDRYVEEEEKKKLDKRIREVNRKYKLIARNYNRNREMFEWQDKNMAIVVPQKASDIVWEGRKQHHCVGNGDHYISNMNDDQGFILFLRRLDCLEVPYYTIELTADWKVKQRYAAYDRQPDIKQIDSFLKKWVKEKKPKIVQIEVAV